MQNKLIRVALNSSEGSFSECRMSVELFQNARQTMGELRDIMRMAGFSWDFIQHEIDLANHPNSPVGKALDSIDPYSTGIGNSLRDLPSNVW